MSGYQEYRLENGLTVCAYPLNHLHSIEMALYFKGGALYEGKRNRGITHLMQHMCLKNLNGIDKGELAARLAAIGATLKGTTYIEAMVFRLKVAPRYFDEAFDILNSFFALNKWTGEELAEEKALVLRQIENQEEDYWSAIDSHYWRTPAGPLAIRGTAETVEAITLRSLTMWRKALIHPANACLALSGNFSDGMLQKAMACMGEWPGTEAAPLEQPAPTLFSMRDESCDYITNAECDKAEVQLSFDINDDLVFPFCVDVLNTIVGEGEGSALFVELRDRLALTDEVFSTIEEVGPFRRMTIEFALPNQLLPEALAATFSVLAKLRQHISTRKINRTRVIYGENLHFLLDQADVINERMGWGFLSGNGEECDLSTQSHMYEDMTKEDMLDAAQAVFRPENMCSYIVKDDSMISNRKLKGILRKCRAMLG